MAHVRALAVYIPLGDPVPAGPASKTAQHPGLCFEMGRKLKRVFSSTALKSQVCVLFVSQTWGCKGFAAVCGTRKMLHINMPLSKQVHFGEGLLKVSLLGTWSVPRVDNRAQEGRCHAGWKAPLWR